MDMAQQLSGQIKVYCKTRLEQIISNPGIVLKTKIHFVSKITLIAERLLVFLLLAQAALSQFEGDTQLTEIK